MDHSKPQQKCQSTVWKLLPFFVFIILQKSNLFFFGEPSSSSNAEFGRRRRNFKSPWCAVMIVRISRIFCLFIFIWHGFHCGGWTDGGYPFWWWRKKPHGGGIYIFTPLPLSLTSSHGIPFFYISGAVFCEPGFARHPTNFAGGRTRRKKVEKAFPEIQPFFVVFHRVFRGSRKNFRHLSFPFRGPLAFSRIPKRSQHLISPPIRFYLSSAIYPAREEGKGGKNNSFGSDLTISLIVFSSPSPSTIANGLDPVQHTYLNSTQTRRHYRRRLRQCCCYERFSCFFRLAFSHFLFPPPPSSWRLEETFLFRKK